MKKSSLSKLKRKNGGHDGHDVRRHLYPMKSGDPWRVIGGWTGPSWKRDKCVSVSYIIYIYIPCKSLQYVVMYVVIPCNSRIIQSSHQQVWHMCVCVIKCLFGSSVPFLSGNSTRGKRHVWVHLDAGCCALTIT